MITVARAQVLRDAITHYIFIFPREDRAKIAEVATIEEPLQVQMRNIPRKEGRPSLNPRGRPEWTDDPDSS